MSSPGRNDPCPCGSGAKYKRCCALTGPGTHVTITDDDRGQAYDLLDRLSRSARYAADLDLALALMHEGDAPGPLDDPDNDIQIGWFQDWLAFDMLLRPSQTTLADEALRSHAHALRPGARQFIRQMQQAPLRLLQVQTTYFGAVALCKDQLDPSRRYRVTDGDLPFERHALFIARIVERGLCWEVEGEPGFIDFVDRRRLIRSILRLRRESLAESAGPALARMVEGAALVRMMAANEAMLDGEIETAEGDPLDPVTTHFTIVDSAALTRCLANAPDFVAHDERSFAWHPSGEAKKGRYTLAHLAIDGDALEVRAVTPQRAERARLRLEELAGGAVMFSRVERTLQTEAG